MLTDVGIYGSVAAIMKRKSKTKSATVSRVDPGTPETRAKLQQPPWDNWPSELKAAAIGIDLAVRLIAGASMAQAQDLEHVSHMAAQVLDEEEERLLRRYGRWRDAMKARRWPVSTVLNVIIDLKPPTDTERLRQALKLYFRLGA